MIAIIMPCLNNLWYTKTAIESIAKNSYPHYLEFFIINNGSTDGTSEYLKSLKIKSLIENNSNVGVTKSWNQGIKAALDSNADYFCILNNDIVCGPHWLDSIIEALSKNEKEFYFPNGNIQHSKDFDKKVIEEVKKQKGIKSPGKCGWAMFFTKKTIEKFYPIPEQFKIWYNDDYIYYKLMDEGYSALTLHDSIIHHFGSKTVLNTVNGKLQFGPAIDSDRAEFLKYAKDNLKSAAIRVQMGY